MTSIKFRSLREGLHVIPADLKVPEVVVDEVVNRFREDLAKGLEQKEKADAVLSRLLANKRRVQLKKTDVAQAAEAYREWFVSALEELAVTILPYPNVPHKTVVARDLMRKRPFKPNGSGYRDFLIWESIRNIMHRGSERVVFVTENKIDFGDNQGIAEELRKDIVNPERLELVLGLNDFNEKFVLPRLKMVDDLKKKLQTKAGASFDVARWVLGNLVDLLNSYEIGDIIAGFPDGVGRVEAEDIVSLESINVEDARELSAQATLVYIAVQAFVNFSIDVNWDDYVLHSEVREWFGNSPESFSWASTDEVSELEIGIRLVLDSKGKKLIDREIKSIVGPLGSVEIK